MFSAFYAQHINSTTTTSIGCSSDNSMLDLYTKLINKTDDNPKIQVQGLI